MGRCRCTTLLNRASLTFQLFFKLLVACLSTSKLFFFSPRISAFCPTPNIWCIGVKRDKNLALPSAKRCGPIHPKLLTNHPNRCFGRKPPNKCLSPAQSAGGSDGGEGVEISAGSKSNKKHRDCELEQCNDGN